MRFLLSAALGLVLAVPLSAQDEDRPLYRTSYRVINVHRHRDTPTPEALQAELEVLDRVGVDVVVNLLMEGGWSDAHLPAWLELKKKHPERLVIFGSIPFQRLKQPTFFTDIVREVEVQHRLGVQGLKLWKDLGMYLRDADGRLLKADDPRLDPFWARCAELKMPILFHVADPREYWYPLTYNSFHYGLRPEKQQFHGRQDMPSWEELIRQRDHVLEKHPKLVMIGAHMGSMTFDLDGLAQRLERYPNFHVECAARLRILGRLNPNAVRDFFVKYQDRVMFGTDSSMLHGVSAEDGKGVRQWQERAARFYSRHLKYFETDRVDLVEPYGSAREWLRLAGCRLPPEVLEKFYHANAERLIPGLARPSP